MNKMSSIREIVEYFRRELSGRLFWPTTLMLVLLIAAIVYVLIDTRLLLPEDVEVALHSVLSANYGSDSKRMLVPAIDYSLVMEAIQDDAINQREIEEPQNKDINPTFVKRMSEVKKKIDALVPTVTPLMSKLKQPTVTTSKGALQKTAVPTPIPTLTSTPSRISRISASKTPSITLRRTATPSTVTKTGAATPTATPSAAPTQGIGTPTSKPQSTLSTAPPVVTKPPQATATPKDTPSPPPLPTATFTPQIQPPTTTATPQIQPPTTTATPQIQPPTPTEVKPTPTVPTKPPEPSETPEPYPPPTDRPTEAPTEVPTEAPTEQPPTATEVPPTSYP